jgi:hypothetical protein
MFSVITNIYNKKTKGPTLMGLFTATVKLKKFFLTNRDVRCVHHGWHGTHRYDTQVLATHASTWEKPFSHYIHSHRLAAEMWTTMKNNFLGKKNLSFSFYLYRFRKYVSYGFAIINFWYPGVRYVTLCTLWNVLYKSDSQKQNAEIEIKAIQKCLQNRRWIFQGYFLPLLSWHI